MKHAEQTIADLENRLDELNAEARKIKSAINCLCDVMNKPPKYQDIDEESDKMAGQRPDEFYGRPLATVITDVLEKRQAAGQGAASLDEIYEQLVAGGYEFTGKNDGIKKRGLAISMSKTSRKFHHLPNDTWGLKAWYPGARDAKKNAEDTKPQTQEPSDENILNIEDSDKEQ